MDDLTLVARAVAGEEAAFRELVVRHESAVARTVTAMLGAGDDADDVGQETFVRFFRALPRFRGDSEVRTYLLRIAMNLSCDALARRRRRSGWVRLDTSDDDPPVDAPDQQTLMEQDERKEIVTRAVQSLDPKHRAVVVLRLLDERSTAEAAQILGVPEGTIMSRLKRALAKLEQMLSPELSRE